MFAQTKSGEAAARRDLRMRLTVEQLTGLPQDTGNGYINEAMQWGLDHEAEAIAAYEALTGQMTAKSGFLAHNDVMAGCSLDAHIGDFAFLVECKCPKSATHWAYLRGPAEVPAEHIAQVRHQLYVTGAEWCDFFSYDPRFPEHLRKFQVRYYRDETEMATYGEKLKAFLDEVAREVVAAKGWHAAEGLHLHV
jgi:hypothetical protein